MALSPRRNYRLLPACITLLFLLAFALAASGSLSPAHAATTCSAYAGPAGNDANPGTAAAPFRTVQKLVNSLSAGRTGCLSGGASFVESVTFGAGGTAGSPVTLTTEPGTPRATIKGVLYVPPTSSYVTIDNLRVDATDVTQSVAIQLFGDFGKLTNSDVFGGDQSRIGVQVGYQKTVKGVEIANNRIHDFGVSGIYDHGIYLDLSDGALVHDNYIYDNAGGYGIQLWTHAMNGRIYRNTIDGNGAGSIIVAGQQNSYGGPSSGNEIDHNILSNPISGTNITIFWSSGGPTGTGNTVHDNVYWKGGLDPGSAYCGGSCSGVTYTANVNADPAYVDRSSKDFNLRSGSAALGYGVAASSPPPQTAPSGASSIASGSTLTGKATWTVTTSAPVAAVEFSVNDQVLASVPGSPATYVLDTAQLPNGAALLGFTMVVSDGSRYAQTVGSVTIANPPANLMPPEVSGAPLVGQLLTASTGSWSGYPSFSYAWRRCDVGGLLCTTIAGATASTYTVVPADLSSTLRVLVVGSSSLGSAAAASAPTAIVSGSITSVAEGTVLSGIHRWTATPPAGTTSVEFWADGTRLQLLTVGPYVYDVDTTRYANGAHIVGVAWTDSTGVRHPASPATNVTVLNAFSSITAGAVITGSVRWTATAPAGTRSVEFWIDNRKLATLTSSPYLYRLNTRQYANGAHTLGIAWTDSGGTRHPAWPIAVSIAN
jgi:hypothetical protein